MRPYLTLFVAALSTVFLPVPEEATLLGAGYAARYEGLLLAGCFAAAWAAIMVGDMTSYAAGRFLLARILESRFGRRVFPEVRRAWATRLVAASGTRAIVVARFLVGLRGFVYLSIGAARYPFPAFVVVNGAAAVVEVGALVAVGYVLGDLRSRPHLGTAIDLVAAAILVLAFFGPALMRRLLNKGSVDSLGE